MREMFKCTNKPLICTYIMGMKATASMIYEHNTIDMYLSQGENISYCGGIDTQMVGITV